MYQLKHLKEQLLAVSAILLNSIAFNANATATYDPA